MPINEINNTALQQSKNNPVKAYESIKNNEKNNVSIEKPELNNPKSDSLNVSQLSANKAEQKQYYDNSAKSEGSKAITDNYMSDIVKKGKEVPKPDNVEMDDVSWGLLVQMGEKMGLTDADRLAKLTVEDVEAYFYTYFYNKNILERGKNLIKDNLTANEYVKYKKETMSDKEYWDMVFEAKAKNEPYSISTINKTNTGLKLSANEFFSNKGNISVTNVSASSLHNVLMAIESEDTALFTYSINNLKTTSKEKTIEQNQKEMIESYDALQEYAQKALSPYEQLQIIKNNLKNGSLVAYNV